MAEYLFKTVYFPRERVRNGSSARVTVSIPTNHGALPEFVSFASQLSSRDFRLAIGDPFVEDIEALAQQDGRSFSNVCMRQLSEYYAKRVGTGGVQKGTGPVAKGGPQLPLPFLSSADPAIESTSESDEPAGDLGVTFRDSLRQRVFGWYPYVEGFSATYTRDAILRYHPKTV